MSGKTGMSYGSVLAQTAIGGALGILGAVIGEKMLPKDREGRELVLGGGLSVLGLGAAATGSALEIPVTMVATGATMTGYGLYQMGIGLLGAKESASAPDYNIATAEKTIRLLNGSGNVETYVAIGEDGERYVAMIEDGSLVLYNEDREVVAVNNPGEPVSFELTDIGKGLNRVDFILPDVNGDSGNRTVKLRRNR